MEYTTLEDIEEAGGAIVRLKQQIEWITNRYALSEFDAVKLRRLRSGLRGARRKLKKNLPGASRGDVYRYEHEIQQVTWKYKPAAQDEDALLQLRADLKRAALHMKALKKSVPCLPNFEISEAV